MVLIKQPSSSILYTCCCIVQVLLMMTALQDMVTDVCNGQMTASVDISSPVVSEGEDVTIRCWVANYKLGGYIFWLKRQDGMDTQMGVANDLNDVFLETGRYSADEPIEEGGEVVYVLSISGVVPEDSGEIGCQTSDKNSKEFTSLDIAAIPVPLTEISLWGMSSNDTAKAPIEQFEDGQLVPFHEGSAYYFQCMASGGTTPPKFTLTIGDRDITDKFTVKTSSELSEGQPGLKRRTWSGKATTTSPVVVTNDQNAKEYRCSAVGAGSDSEPLTIHIQPVLRCKLRFPPILTCPERVGLDLYASPVDGVSCVVKSDPPITALTWSWLRMDKFNESISMADEETEGCYSHKIKDGASPDELISTLYTHRAFPEVFRKYTLIAKNALGQSSATVSLIIDNPGASESGSPRLSVTSFLLCITSLLALIKF